jgi:hypothetical protein
MESALDHTVLSHYYFTNLKQENLEYHCPKGFCSTAVLE